MPTILTQLSTEPLTAERTWTVEEIPVLTASISLPAPAEGTGLAAARRIRRLFALPQHLPQSRHRAAELFLAAGVSRHQPKKYSKRS